MNTGEKIKLIRKRQSITQKDLAEKLGTTPQNIAQYENNKRNPKYNTLEKIAKALRIDIQELLPDSDYNFLLGDKAPVAYRTLLEQILGSRGYTFGMTEDTDELYINFRDGILTIEDDDVDKLSAEIESYVDFKMYELRKNHKNNFIPKKYFDYVERTIKPEYNALNKKNANSTNI